MELAEKNNNDLEQYIVLDSITICIEKQNEEIIEIKKKMTFLYVLVVIQIILLVLMILG